MPYYIRKDAPECKSGWAVVKDNGEQISCQETKDMAIKQMVAISIDEGIEPGGDWKDRKSSK